MNAPSLPPSRASLLLAFAAVYFIWGSTYLAIRVAIESLPGFLMAGARFCAAGAILYAYGRLRGGRAPERRHWGPAIVIGAALLLVGNGVVVWVEHRIPSSLAALLVATEPLWIVLLDWARPNGVRPARVELIGVVIGFTGVALLIGPVEGGGAADLLSAGALVVSTFAWALGSLYARGAAMPESAPVATGMKMMSGGALLLLAGTVTGEWGRFDPAAVTARSVVAFLYLMVFGSLIAFSAYVFLLRVTTVARASTYAFVNPVVAVSLGALLGGEAVTWRTAAATVVIVGAVALITTARLGAGREPKGDGRAAAPPLEAEGE